MGRTDLFRYLYLEFHARGKDIVHLIAQVIRVYFADGGSDKFVSLLHLRERFADKIKYIVGAGAFGRKQRYRTVPAENELHYAGKGCFEKIHYHLEHLLVIFIFRQHRTRCHLIRLAVKIKLGKERLSYAEGTLKEESASS